MKSKFSDWEQARIVFVEETDSTPEAPCSHANGFYQFEGETYCRDCNVNEDLVAP